MTKEIDKRRHEAGMAFRRDLLQAECDGSARRRQEVDLLARIRELAANTTIADEAFIVVTLASAIDILHSRRTTVPTTSIARQSAAT
jgi:hypothetical protein